MGQRIREITEEQCQWFADDMRDLAMKMDQLFSRHREFERLEWLGGDQKANNYETPPERCAKAMAHLRKVRKLVADADHEVIMYRAELV